MEKILLLLAAISALIVDAHDGMILPYPRTGNCYVNGVVFGTSAPADKQDDQNDPDMYHHHFVPDPRYHWRACGGVSSIDLKKTVELCGTDQKLYNTALPSPKGSTTYQAGEEVELTFKGYLHPGVIRVALCYGNDCNSWNAYDDHILGYWFVEGCSGGDEDIYACKVKAKVKMPQRNGKASLQFLVSSEDARSYVSCADVEITGADNSGVVYCNGHPFCDCTPSWDKTSSFGLMKTCPFGYSARTGGSSPAFKEQLGIEGYCQYCVQDGCPATCGGPWFGNYNGPTCNPRYGKAVAGCSTAPYKNNFNYVECSLDKPCACVTCEGGKGSMTPLAPGSRKPLSAKPDDDWGNDGSGGGGKDNSDDGSEDDSDDDDGDKEAACVDKYGTETCEKHYKPFCDRNVDYINENCAKTCGLCSNGDGGSTPLPPPKCYDKYGQKSCEDVYKPFCSRNVDYINENCAKTCGLCSEASELLAADIDVADLLLQ